MYFTHVQIVSWTDRARGDYSSSQSAMGKLLSVEVRRSMEIQFSGLHVWLDLKERKPLHVMMAYHRIEYEEAWVTSEEDDLYTKVPICIFINKCINNKYDLYVNNDT